MELVCARCNTRLGVMHTPRTRAQETLRLQWTSSASPPPTIQTVAASVTTALNTQGIATTALTAATKALAATAGLQLDASEETLCVACFSGARLYQRCCVELQELAEWCRLNVYDSSRSPSEIFEGGRERWGGNRWARVQHLTCSEPGVVMAFPQLKTVVMVVNTGVDRRRQLEYFKAALSWRRSFLGPDVAIAPLETAALSHFAQCAECWGTCCALDPLYILATNAPAACLEVWEGEWVEGGVPAARFTRTGSAAGTLVVNSGGIGWHLQREYAMCFNKLPECQTVVQHTRTRDGEARQWRAQRGVAGAPHRVQQMTSRGSWVDYTPLQ